MATTYEFIEDAPGNRWQFVQKESGNFQSGEWYAKGLINFDIDDAKQEVILQLSQDEEKVVPISYISAPVAGSTEALFDALAAIIY